MILQAVQEHPPMDPMMVAISLRINKCLGESSQETWDIGSGETHGLTVTNVKLLRKLWQEVLGRTSDKPDPLGQSPDQIQYEIELNKALACRIDLNAGGMSISQEVRKFLCEELPHSEPAEANRIIAGLNNLERVIRESFRNIISIALEMFENPELPEERNIRVRVRVKDTAENTLQQYDRYTRSFIKEFPFEFSRWFITTINYA